MSEVSGVITDARGRSLEVKRLGRRDSMRLMRQWGTASNVETWLGNSLLAACVRAIDNVPVPMPQTVDQVEVLADRLDDAGLRAVADWLAAQQAEVDPQAVRDAAKN
jgi:uncharacterized protein YidB (DUF937 family)